MIKAAFAPAPLPALPTRKAAARVALVGLNEPTRALLAECFRQFNIQTVTIPADAPDRLQKEKFEACVFSLRGDSGAMMEAARSSPSNGRCVIYGVGGNAQEAMRYSKYGINAMFHEPLERPAALKLLRATQNLVLHEFRRYVRIPLMMDVAISGDGKRLLANSIEMSTGGMSLQSHEEIKVGTNVEVSFSILTLPRIHVRGTVSWRKPKTFGVRFDPTDDRRQQVKTWVNSYLEN
jgi:Tfp pilus assembly protein PilZ